MILLSSSFNSFIQLLGAIIIFVLVLVITYFTTRWLGSLQRKQMTTGNLQVVETARVANNKYVQIVKAGNIYLVIAIGKDEITKLAELDEDQLEEIVVSETKTDSFQKLLDKLKNDFPKKQD